jgi:hypothetical protein
VLALEQQLVLDPAAGAPVLSQLFLLVAGVRACYWLAGQFGLPARRAARRFRG